MHSRWGSRPCARAGADGRAAVRPPPAHRPCPCARPCPSRSSPRAWRWPALRCLPCSWLPRPRSPGTCAQPTPPVRASCVCVASGPAQRGSGGGGSWQMRLGLLPPYPSESRPFDAASRPRSVREGRHLHGGAEAHRRRRRRRLQRGQRCVHWPTTCQQPGSSLGLRTRADLGRVPARAPAPPPEHAPSSAAGGFRRAFAPSPSFAQRVTLRRA